MENDIQNLIDRGYTYEEMLSQGLCDTFDMEDYESSMSIPQLKTSEKLEKKKKKKQKDIAIKYDLDF